VTREAHVNGLIRLFGESVRGFFRDQQRSSMTSPMFNLPGRMVLGSHCYHEHLPGLLPEILRRTTPQAIGRRMRRLCARPSLLHLNSLVLGYLIGREQSRLAGTPCGEEFEQVAAVMEFWEAVARSCRTDCLCLPEESGGTIPVLPDAALGDLAQRLRSDLPEDLRRRIRRMLATLELYTFILHGEARVGVFHHGPYALPGGDCIVVKELVGMRETYYPWAGLERPPTYDRLACVMRLRGVQARLVLFGTLTTTPPDYASLISAEEVFVVDDDGARPLPHAEIDGLTEIAAGAQMELYRRVIDWNDKYRIEYGAELYGCLLKSFADDLGFGEEFGGTIRERFAGTVRARLDDLYEGRERPWVLEHIATTDGPIFAPVAGGWGQA